MPGQSENVQQRFPIANAFEAQRPRSDALSKQGMSQYLKRARTTSRGNSASPESSSSTATGREDPSLSDNIAGPAGRWGLSSSGTPRAFPAPERNFRLFALAKQLMSDVCDCCAR